MKKRFYFAISWLYLIKVFFNNFYLSPDFVYYKKTCTPLAAVSDKVYQLLAHGRWFSPASSTTKTGRYDIAEILLKVALNTIRVKVKDEKVCFYFIVNINLSEQ
jgi:hypothetical protein